MKCDMQVSLLGKTLKNPVIAASGTFGFGMEYSRFFNPGLLGGIALKALTAAPREGNDPVRVAETKSGMLNSVGLQNPGVDAFLKTFWNVVKKLDTVLIANVAGSTKEEYIDVVKKLSDTEIDFLEINVSCPNVAHGGVNMGTDEKILYDLVSALRKETKKPLIVKLTPNVTDIKKMAVCAQEAGADALSLINTLTGMAINAKTRRPVLANKTGGLSGPAIKPVALRMVSEVYRSVQIPVIGMGGIMTGQDAAEFMIAGAAAVMVGTATLADPYAAPRIAGELETFAEEENLEKISALTGTLILD